VSLVFSGSGIVCAIGSLIVGLALSLVSVSDSGIGYAY
jgi:hypothetical protein